MKKHLHSIASTLFAVVVLNSTLIAQINPIDNSRIPMEQAVIQNNEKQVAVTKDYSKTTGITCNPNSFYGISGTNVIEMTLVGNTVTTVGVVVNSSGGDANLAFCNNLNGGGFSPTFYNTVNYDTPAYFDGTTWVSTNMSVNPAHLVNAGGGGNYLYYIYYDQSFSSRGIERYDGANLSLIYTWDSTRATGAADIAVDDFGNAWFFTAQNNGSLFADSLYEISPTGQLLGQYGCGIDANNAYGSFMLNNILYLGLGGGNPVHPNSILPITISGNNAIAGTAISMTGSYSDLASCNPGNPLAIAENPDRSNLSVYPNPAKDFISVSSNKLKTGDEIKILDVLGKEVFNTIVTGNSIRIDLHKYDNGVYFVKVNSKSISASVKLVIQR